MPSASFFTSLALESRRVDSLLCVGLDPSLDIPTPDVLPWMKAVVDATAPFVCAYKPNSAFYEARGVDGWNILEQLISHAHAAGRVVILDAKRGDIASTAEAYAKASFDVLGADAVTVNPLLGGDSVESFACRADKGVFLLCHTSNPGARDLQELQVDGRPLFELVAEKALGWNTRGNIGLVVGATYPGMLARVRAMSPDMWILLPGVGAQGGDLEHSLAAGLDSADSGVLVNVSRDYLPGSGSRLGGARVQGQDQRSKKGARGRPPRGWPRRLSRQRAAGPDSARSALTRRHSLRGVHAEVGKKVSPLHRPAAPGERSVPHGAGSSRAAGPPGASPI